MNIPCGLDLAASRVSGLSARLCRQAVIVLGASWLVTQAVAAPIAIDLGNLTTDEQVDYQTPSTSFGVTLTSQEVKWFSFTLTGAITSGNGLYLDIDSYPSNNHHVDTTIGLYSSDGELVAVNADAGTVFYAQLSFGETDPERGPLTYTVGDETFTSNPAKGINGNLLAGTYYLAVTRFHATFADDFVVTSTANGTDNFLLQFRGQATSAIPEPSTMTLLGLSLGFLLQRTRRRRQLN